ncbi:MAG TPA: hypothetical protein VNO54_29230, partial [Streptosporangiaceae bacterium]|nr:hypothetical protein [Streptosporangiaceae bacterium]
MTGSPATRSGDSDIVVRVPGDVASWPRRSSGPGLVSDRESWARVIRQARCAASGLDADEWFPVST